MFPYEEYPYTNFHDLNLAYFLTHFREIFSRWAELYETMQSWKTATEQELEDWKTTVLDDINAWETALMGTLDQWEDEVMAGLEAWKTAFQTLFDDTFSNLEDIKTDAEAARDAALTAQTAAEAAATAAASSAAGVQSSLNQISTNTNDIKDLDTRETELENIVTETTPVNIESEWTRGGFAAMTGETTRTGNIFRMIPSIRYNGSNIGVYSINPDIVFRVYAWENGNYVGVFFGDGFRAETESPSQSVFNISEYPNYDIRIAIYPADTSRTLTIEDTQSIVFRNAIEEEIPTTTINWPLDSFQSLKALIGNLNVWAVVTSSSNYSESVIVAVPSNATKIRIINNNNAAIAFLNSADFNDIHANTTPDFSTEYPARIAAFTGTQEFIKYSDVNYVYIAKASSGGTSLLPEAVEFDITDSKPVFNYNQSDNSLIIETILTEYNYFKFDSELKVARAIRMPIRSRIKGLSNNATILFNDTNVPSALKLTACILMATQCHIEGCRIFGQTGTITLDGIDTGIDGVRWTDAQAAAGVIDGCYIAHFTGSGIRLANQGTPTNRELFVTNNHIVDNNYGIYIEKNSEFNRIANNSITHNYYGVVSRGGNNVIIGCGIDSNTYGIVVNDDDGSNHGHGTCTGCTINHNAQGGAVVIEGTGRMIMSNTQIHYGNIELTDTNGNIFDSCDIGRGVAISITNGDANIFSNSFFRVTNPFTLTNNTQTKLNNCFTLTGDAVTL